MSSRSTGCGFESHLGHQIGINTPIYLIMKVHFFDEKLEEFIKGLEKPIIAKVLRTIDLLEMFGHHLGMPHSKRLGGGLSELRVGGIQEVRFIYAFHRGEAVLLQGFLKKSRQIPRKEIEMALQKLSTLDRL